MKWLIVAIMVAATTAGEVLQAYGMRRHGVRLWAESGSVQSAAVDIPCTAAVPAGHRSCLGWQE